MIWYFFKILWIINFIFKLSVKLIKTKKKPLKRNNEQYGWYVYIDRVKADFGGVHIPLDKSKTSAIEFIQKLKNHLATWPNCGKLLRAFTTTHL